ncbi:FUSC family protein [Deinococcus petrolearius]|uniref:FUSC family protein n=1 Tax=Deinococcus petrolearius TaxID=1751295 RepID=A0ABW1DJH9_9DEIO
MTRRLSLVLKTAFAFDAPKWRPATALRCTVGVAVPVLLGALSGDAALGVLSATGALNAGLASFTGVTRSRLRVMLTSSVLMGVITVVALWAGPSTLATTLGVALISFLLVLYGAQGAAATTVAIQSTMTLIVLTGLRLPADLALPGGALVLAGGLLQVLLTVMWPARPHYAERRAVALVYRRLEHWVGALPLDEHALLDAGPLQEAWDLLNEARALLGRGPGTGRARQEHAALRQALRVAEGLRAALVGYLRADRELRREGPEGERQARALAATLLLALREIEQGVRRGGSSSPAAHRRELERAAADLGGPAGEELRFWAGLIAGLLADLDSPPLPEPPPDQQRAAALRPALGEWPRSASLRTLLGRHALKYALVLGLSVYVERRLNVPHGYWLPLTVGVVLRQDYVSTLTRGVARLGGTLAGVGLGALLTALHPPHLMLALLSVVAAFFAYALFPAGYAAFSGAITLYVLLSVVGSGLSEGQAAAQRLVFTLLGGAVAILAYLLWPSWQGPGARRVLRDAAEAQRRYLLAVQALGHADRAGPETAPVPAVPGRLGGKAAGRASQTREEARRLRVQAESLVRAAGIEPAWGQGSARARHSRHCAEAALLRLQAGAARSLSLHAQALLPFCARPPEAEAELARALDDAAELVASLEDERAGGAPERPAG